MEKRGEQAGYQFVRSRANLVGYRVRHTQHGLGTVKSFDGTLITITFDNPQTKFYNFNKRIGVGKSSFTGVLKKRTPDLGVMIDVDKITAELGGNPLAGDKAALTMIRGCMNRNESFAQETTLSGYKTEATAKEVKALGYHIRMFYIGLDTLSESHVRIENRVKRGGHNIPKDDVQLRFSGR